MTELLGAHSPVNLICLGLLGVLLLRKLVLMDGYHRLRVALLTALLWIPVIRLFLNILGSMLMPHSFCGNDPGVYAVTEM